MTAAPHPTAAGQSATTEPQPALLVVATVGSTIGAFLTPYAEHFRERGWRVEAAAADASLDARVRQAFDSVHDLPLSRSLRDVKALARAAGAIRGVLDTPFDIVHVHTPIAGFLTRALVRLLPRERRPAVVYTAHGFHFRAGGTPIANVAFRTAERLGGRWTDRLIVINDEDEEAARRHRIVPPRRLVRMPGIGLDTGRYTPDAVPEGATAEARARIGIPVDAPMFVIVGELNRNKRQADAVDALARMRGTGARLVLAGDGPERSALAARARSAGVEDRVHFLGLVGDIRPVARAATAVMLLSAREGLARSVMEALSLGMPVIASTARGNRELVGTDRGIVYETGDVDTLVDAMRWMMDHPIERRKMGERGRALMVDRYDLSVLIGLHEGLYREIMEERDRS